MSETGNTSIGQQAYLEQIARALESAVSSMSGQEVRVTPGKLGPVAPDSLLWEQPFDSPAGAKVWAAAPEAVWSALGGLVLREAGLEPSRDEERSTYLELLTQGLSGFSQALGVALKRPVNCVDGKQIDALPGGLAGATFEIALGEQHLTGLWVALSSAFDANERSAASSEAAPGPGAGRGTAQAEDVIPVRSLDLLLDVELPVSVSFGRAQLPLKDVVKLTTGSIVELNRSVTEPVEIIVNNCVIARGEVVVIEGNYGVRIDQIISRHERLRTLR
jgi:flagellar motor switch protein FliN